MAPRPRRARRLALALAAPSLASSASPSWGPNRAFTEGPWVVNGEFAEGCVKDQSWFCETCCCKHGNTHWRDYQLDNSAAGPDTEGEHDSEGLGEPKPDSSEVTQTKSTAYNNWADGHYRYKIVLIDTYPEDCKVCSASHSCSAEACDLTQPGAHADGGLNIMDAIAQFGGGTGGNVGGGSIGARNGPAGGDAMMGEPKGIQAQLWAEQPPSLLQMNDAPQESDYVYVADQQQQGAKDGHSSQDFGWIPSCCDVGYTRNEEGETLPC